MAGRSNFTFTFYYPKRERIFGHRSVKQQIKIFSHRCCLKRLGPDFFLSSSSRNFCIKAVPYFSSYLSTKCQVKHGLSVEQRKRASQVLQPTNYLSLEITVYHLKVKVSTEKALFEK
ncbi:unnamed protein product [Natator depressus]